MVATKKKNNAVAIELEVRTSRNSNEFEVKTFKGEDYDAILESVWDDPGLDWISLDSLTQLNRLAASDREAKRKAEEEATKLEAEKRAAEEARKRRRIRTEEEYL